MKRKLATIFIAVLSAGTIITSAAYALDQWENVQGGHWHYYTSNGSIHSDYQNHYRTHSSSVTVGSRTNSSGWRPRGQWAWASLPTKWYATSRAYYNVI